MQIRLRNLWFAPNRHTYVPNEIITIEDDMYASLPPSAEIISAPDEIMEQEKLKMHYAQLADDRKKQIAELQAASETDTLTRLQAQRANMVKQAQDQIRIAQHEAATAAEVDPGLLAPAVDLNVPTSGPDDETILKSVDAQAGLNAPIPDSKPAEVEPATDGTDLASEPKSAKKSGIKL